jgi:DNA replication protein DnaC
MLSSSPDELSPRESFLLERSSIALNRFDDETPEIYRRPIELPEEVHAWIAGWGGRSLFLTGAIGVGKTHTAWKTCRRWLEAQYGPGQPWQGSPVIKAYRSTALFDALRPDAPEGEGRALVKTLQKVDLLFEIFDERYIRRRPVIITCDVLPNQLSDVTGPRVASRLAEMCGNSIVLLEGPDRRQGAAA